MKQVHGGDIYRNEVLYDFSVNTNPYGPPRGVLSALQKGMEQVSRYPDVYCQELRGAIALQEGIRPFEILCTNGAAEFFFLFVQALEPKKALICTPSFAEYEKALEAVDCTIFTYALREENKFVMQEDFLEIVTKDLDVLFLCSPNNPTGICIPDDLLEQIILKCEANQIHLVLDLCFMDFVSEDQSNHWIKKIHENSYLHCVKAFTKLYTIPGIRLGYGMSNNQVLLECMQKKVQPWNVSSLAQIAGIQALKETVYVKESLRKIWEQREWLITQLKELSIPFWDTKTNYIMFCGPKDLYEHMLQYKILIRDCSNYRGLKKGFYRIAIRTKEENEIFIQVLKACIKQEKLE